MDFDEARHLLSRTTFGATPAEIRALEAQDFVATVDRLLANVRRDAVTPPPGLRLLAASPAHEVSTAAVYDGPVTVCVGSDAAAFTGFAFDV